MIFASKNRHYKIRILQPLKLNKTENFPGASTLDPHRGPKAGPWTPPVTLSGTAVLVV